MQADIKPKAGSFTTKSRYEEEKESNWNVNQSLAKSNANRIEDRDPARYSDDRNNAKNYNGDEDTWDDEQDTAPTSNQGTDDNDWDANDSVLRGTSSRYFDDTLDYKSSSRYDFYDEQRDAAAGDYIDSDHSEYNRGDSRFRWSDPGDDE